jgi:hypothetical protein
MLDDGDETLSENAEMDGSESAHGNPFVWE